MTREEAANILDPEMDIQYLFDFIREHYGKHDEGCAWCKAEYTIIDDEFAQPISQNMIKFCWHCGRKLEGNNESTV